MTERIRRGCNIIKWAIDNKTSLTEASRVFKIGEDFIRKIKKSYVNKDGYREFISLYNKFHNKKDEISTEISEDNLLDKDKRIDSPYLNFVQEQQGKGVLDARGSSHVKSLDAIVREAKIDLSIWNVDRHVINKWDVTNAKGKTYQNWQVKVWLSKIKTDEQQKQWDEFISAINSAAPKYNKVNRSKKGKQYLFELSLADLHIGKLSWALESGEDYETKIAIGRYNEAIEDLIEQVDHLKDKIEEILLPVGNDLINVDNLNNMTTNGTPQSVDSRWQQMFLKAKKMLIYNIDRLTEIAPVKVVMISGNHDTQTIFYLGEALKAWYRNSNSVTIDNGPSARKYFAYGLNLIGYTHGNEEKHQDLGLIMAQERPDLWSQSEYREIHLGHLHKKKETKYVSSDEYQGFKVKILPSLSGTDSWHYRKGYKSQKSAVGNLYHKERGQVGEFTFNV